MKSEGPLYNATMNKQALQSLYYKQCLLFKHDHMQWGSCVYNMFLKKERTLAFVLVQCHHKLLVMYKEIAAWPCSANHSIQRAAGSMKTV